MESSGLFKMIKLNKNTAGYTLIELLIVISIMGILAMIGLPNFHRSIVRAKETSLRRTLFILRDVIDQNYADHGKYPESLEALVEEKYIRHIPEDPNTNSNTTWIIIPPVDEEGAVYDVHSGSDLKSLEGEPYNEW